MPGICWRGKGEQDVERHDEVWKKAALVRTFLDGIRGGIPFATEQIEVMLRLIAARGEPVERVADLGCGSGVLARAILLQYPQAHATLVDFSEPMLDAARAQLRDHVPAPQFVVADLAVPQWVGAVSGQGPFDVVASGYAIHHLVDQRKRDLYREVFALLRPGGVFVNLEHPALDARRVVDALTARGVLTSDYGSRRLRMVTHLDVDDAGIARAIDAFAEVVETGIGAGAR